MLSVMSVTISVAKCNATVTVCYKQENYTIYC